MRILCRRKCTVSCGGEKKYIKRIHKSTLYITQSAKNQAFKKNQKSNKNNRCSS